MSPEEREKQRLESELREAKGKAKEQHKTIRAIIFFAIWWVPFLAMKPSANETEPMIGQVGIRGLWIVLVPVAFWLYCRYLDNDDD